MNIPVQKVLPQFYVLHSNQIIRIPINTGFHILVNDNMRMFEEEPVAPEYSFKTKSFKINELNQ